MTDRDQDQPTERPRTVDRRTLTGTVVAAGVASSLAGCLGGQRAVEATPSERNTELYEKLATAGIVDAVVDISDDRVFVRYNVPRHGEVEPTEILVLTRMATAVQNARSAILEVYQEFEPVEKIGVDAADVAAFRNQEIAVEELRNRMTVKEMN